MLYLLETSREDMIFTQIILSILKYYELKGEGMLWQWHFRNYGMQW